MEAACRWYRYYFSSHFSFSLPIALPRTTKRSLPDQIQRANTQVGEIKSSIHKQTLIVALEDMMRPDNTKYISPESIVPTALMPAGKIFADKATPEEMVSLVRTMMKDIASAQPSDTEKASTPKDELERKYDHDKWIKLTILEVIVGLAPQQTIEQLIQDQITSSGPYEDSAYAVLCLRHQFINDYLLEEGLMSSPMTNFGMYEEALKYLSYLNYIEKLPFKNSVALHVTGMINPDYNFDIDLTNEDVSKMYKTIDLRMKQELKDQFKNPTDETVRTRIAEITTQLRVGSAGH